MRHKITAGVKEKHKIIKGKINPNAQQIEPLHWFQIAKKSVGRKVKKQPHLAENQSIQSVNHNVTGWHILENTNLPCLLSLSVGRIVMHGAHDEEVHRIQTTADWIV